MINYLKGKIIEKEDKYLVLENQGIGFKIFCSSKSLKELSVGIVAQIYTFLCLREDTIELYGFLSKKELELFEVLNEISGIGPKTSLDLSFFGSLEELKKKMEEENFYLEVKGIGKKKMQKILLELTGKIKEISKKEEVPDEALAALVSFGFSKTKAKQALLGLTKEAKTSEERIVEALKTLKR